MSIMKNLSDEKWKSCKYEVNVEIHFSDGTVRSLKKPQIAGLYLEKDFDNDHIPILLLDLALSQIDENAINDDTEFHIRINQFYTEGDGKEQQSPKIWLNDTFVKINLSGSSKDTTSSNIERSIRNSNNMTDDDVAPEDLASQKTYPLGKKSDLMLTKKIVNGVIINADQKAILGYMLSKAGCRKPMLISNLTNPETIAEHIVHPKNLLYNMVYHEKEYGWHQEGTYVFFDYDYLYITRMNGICTTWRPNEPKTICFCISESTSDDNVPSGVLVKNEIVYFNIGFDQYKPANAATVSDQIEGNNMLLISTANGGSKNVQANVKSQGSGAYATKSHHGHNPYMEEQHNRRKIEQETQIELTCTNGDIGHLTPNKQVTILTDVTSIANDFKGNYRLGSFRMSLIKNGDYFDSSTKIIVKRVSK